MGRDSRFLVLTGFEDEGPAFELLAEWLGHPGAPGEHSRSSGRVFRMRDVAPVVLPIRIGDWFSNVWLGTGRNLFPPELLRFMATLPWEHRDRVQVLVNDQDDDVWALWLLRGDGFVEVAQPGVERVLEVPGDDDGWSSLRVESDPAAPEG